MGAVNSNQSSQRQSSQAKSGKKQGKPAHHLRKRTMFPVSPNPVDEASTIILQLMYASNVPKCRDMLSVEGYIERKFDSCKARDTKHLPVLFHNESKMLIASIIDDLEDDEQRQGGNDKKKGNAVALQTIDSYLFRTNKRHPSPDPVWNFTIDLQLTPVKGDVLHLAITRGSGSDARKIVAMGAFNVSELPRDEVITKTLCPISRKVKTTKGLLELGAGLNMSKCCTLSFKVLKTLNQRCRVYFIRHGESTWNEARRDGNYRKLIHFDHILTPKGIKESLALNSTWTNSAEKEEIDSTLQRFLAAETILSSPLTRALQTCLLSLQGHPTFSEKGIKLCRDLREVKSLGGFDAKGKYYGTKIMHRTEQKLKKKVKEMTAGADAADIKQHIHMIENICRKTTIDYNDANSQWWVLKETKADVERRVEDFVSFLRYSPESTFICVGHSMFLKALFSICLCPKWCTLNPEFSSVRTWTPNLLK